MLDPTQKLRKQPPHGTTDESSKHPNIFLDEMEAKLIHVDRSNIVIFGQAGSGKSSIINLLAGRSVADVSGGAAGCTSSNQHYSIPHGADTTYTFWDTAGLNEADNGTVSSQAAVQNLLDLVKDHGVNLLIYCMRPRLVDISRVNYDLFWKIICMEKVPVVLVVTGLEGREDMEEWWQENEKTIKRMRMVFAGHACITSWKGREGMYQNAYDESAEKVWKLVTEHSAPKPWYMTPGWSPQAQAKIVAYEKNYKARSENGMRKFLRELARSLFFF
jgi:predicted GTPase